MLSNRCCGSYIFLFNNDNGEDITAICEVYADIIFHANIVHTFYDYIYNLHVLVIVLPLKLFIACF